MDQPGVETPAPELSPFGAPAVATWLCGAFTNKPRPFSSSCPILFLLTLTHITIDAAPWTINSKFAPASNCAEMCRHHRREYPNPIFGHMVCEYLRNSARGSIPRELCYLLNSCVPTRFPRNRSARIRASTLSVLIWASAMIRVLNGLASKIRSAITSSPESQKASASSYWLRRRHCIQAIVARTRENPPGICDRCGRAPSCRPCASSTQ